MGDLYPTVAPGVVPSANRVRTPQAGHDRGPDRGRSDGMSGIGDLLDAARTAGLTTGHFRGLLHVAIGRRVATADGTVVSVGVTWRELAGILKTLRYDRDLVREFGIDPEALAPRDRERFWYAAIAQARVDGREAVLEADRLVGPLKALGYVVGVHPSSLAPPAAPPPPKASAKPAEKPPVVPDEKPAKRKKK